MKVTILLAKNVLALLRITAAVSEIDAGIQKKYMILVVLCRLLCKKQL